MTATWIPTYSGRRIDLCAPRACDIDIMDIAVGLSRHSRWAGQTATDTGLTVAEHSVAVSHLAPDEDAMWGLLHDAAEAYIGDVPRPLKHLLPGYAEFENRILRAVAKRFGIPPPPFSRRVRHADDFRLAWEARDYYLPSLDIPGLLTIGPSIGRLPAPMGQDEAKASFLNRFIELNEAQSVSAGGNAQ